MIPIPSRLTKEYGARGPLHEFRFAESVSFHCFRCGASKKSKLIAIYLEDWERRLCNGCYGYLLSIYAIKASSEPDEEKANQLASVLLSVLARDDLRRHESLLLVAENRAKLLSKRSLRFLVTAEYVATAFEGMTGLDWSAAVIGLCKAVEVETVERILGPTARELNSSGATPGEGDRDLRRVSRFCKDPGAKAPELGTVAYFLNVVITDQQRRTSSPLVGGFLKAARSWEGSGWVLAPNGLRQSLSILASDYRNPSAHTEEIREAQYLACKDLVLGTQEILWRLVAATKVHK